MRELNTQEYNQYKRRLMNLTWFMYSEKKFDGEDEEGYKDFIREELKGSKQEMKAILKIIYTEGSTIKMINKKLEIIHGEINTLFTSPSYTADPDSIEDDFVYKTLEKLGIATRHSNSHSRAAIKRSRKTRNHNNKSKRRKKKTKRRKKKSKRRKKTKRRKKF